MAPLKVRKPGAVMFDLVATATKSFFIDQVLFPYIKINAKTYMENNWDNDVLQHDIKLLREASKKDKSAPQVADASADAETIRKSVVVYVSKALDELKDNEALTQFRFHVLFDGYAKGNIETPIYTDVAIQIRHWAVDDAIKLYIFSNGWKEATKRYLQKTNHGDMNLLIKDHFDTSEGPLTEAATFKKVVGKVGLAPEDILFLTHNGKEGYAAKKAGLSVILIMTHRRDVDKLSEEEKKDLPYVRSFNEIIFSGNAPKAKELDGSSVVEEEDKKSDAGKGSASSASKTMTACKVGAGAPTSAKSKSKAASTSADASSASNAEAGLSEAFSTGASKKSAKKPSAASASKGQSKSASVAVKGATSKSACATKKSADGSAASSSKPNSADAASSSQTKADGSKSSSSVAANSKASKTKAASSSKEAGGSKSSSCTGSKTSGSKAASESAGSSKGSKSAEGSKAEGSKSSAASSSKGGSKSAEGSKAEGGSKTSTGGSSKGSKSAEGSKAGSGAGASASKSSSKTSSKSSSQNGSAAGGSSASGSKSKSADK